MGRVERRAVQSVDAVLATSEADASVFRGWGARRVEIVPNGVDTTAVTYRAPATGAGLVYLGQFGYRPNEVAAVELVHEVLPRVRERVPEATVTLVGRNAGDGVRALAGDHVAVLGEVDSVLPYLHQAGAMVVPLHAGSGTRLKILEAMAAGTPVVSTPLGAAGIDAVDGRHLLLAETPADLAEQVVRVLTDEVLATGLSRAARTLVEERYDWSVSSATLQVLARDLLAVAPCGAPKPAPLPAVGSDHDVQRVSAVTATQSSTAFVQGEVEVRVGPFVAGPEAIAVEGGGEDLEVTGLG